MRRRIQLLLFVGTLVNASCGPAPGPPSFDEQARAVVDSEVRQASDALLAAMNAGDRDGVFTFYLDDPSFVYLGCTEYIVGGATFRQMVGPVYGREEPETFDFQVVSSSILSPDAAVLSLRGRSSVAPALFLTQVWSRVDGDWRIIRVHESWPGCREPRAPHPFTGSPEGAALAPGIGGG